MTGVPNDPEVLTTVPTEAEAAMVVNFLEAQGIAAMAEGGLTSAFRAEAPGRVRVLVRQSDMARAKAALADLQQDLSEIDWSNIDVGDSE